MYFQKPPLSDYFITKQIIGKCIYPNEYIYSNRVLNQFHTYSSKFYLDSYLFSNDTWKLSNKERFACTCALKPTCQLIGPDDVVQLCVVIHTVHHIGKIFPFEMREVHLPSPVIQRGNIYNASRGWFLQQVCMIIKWPCYFHINMPCYSNINIFVLGYLKANW